MRSERRTLDGLVGPIEIALDWPHAHDALRGIAYVGHPHPLYGGTLDNKVAATIARAFAGMGWLAVRPNFRGVGKTAGTHDEGRGETDDFLHVIDTLPRALSITAPPLRALAGFSFGSFVAARAVQLLAARNEAPQHVVLVGAAAGKWPLPTVPDACRFGSLIVHGEYDETIPLAHVLDWARPQDLPIVVLPGADHFFHRRLSILKRLIVQHVTAGTATDAIDAVGQND